MSHAADLYPFDLGDRRLDRRAARLVQAALDNPGASIPAAAGSPAAAEAAYRFLDNPAVRPEDLDAAHRRYTLGLLAGADGPVLLAQDTTPLDFTSPARNHGLGQLAHARHFGLFAHSALAMTEGGLPLGLLHRHVWARPPGQRGKRKQRRRKETADKESQRWLDTEAACAAALPPGRTVVTIGDREADFYDYFAAPRRPGQHAPVRAKPRRRLAGTKELPGAAMRAGPVRGMLAVEVPRKDGRPGRRAVRELRHGTFALRPPSTHPRRKELPPLPSQAVLAEEADPPAGAEPVRWLLLTTLPVAGAADAARLVRWYTYRWRVERYHFVLKSGCQLEELQLETGARLRRALALYGVVPARLLHLTYLARQGPEAPCEPAVSREEWELLWRHFRPGQAPPAAAPPLREALHWVARLGGFLGRTGDGEPGVKVLWRGLRKLHDMVVGARLARAAAEGVQSSDE